MKLAENIKEHCFNHLNLSIFGAQIAIYAMFVAIWAMVTILLEHDTNIAIDSIRVNATVLFLLLVEFMVNFYLLVPKLYLHHDKLKKGFFWGINLIIVLLWNCYIISHHKEYSLGTSLGLEFYQSGVIWLLLNYAMIVAAILMHYYINRSRHLRYIREQKQRTTEAELAWLRNQLNPHFLFNTLNNISSLTQIAPQRAQNAIGDLSEILRYALYETEVEEVLLADEVKFIQNYIKLMALRCNPNVEIKTLFDIRNSQRRIAPLLFLTPIENAFRCGISTERPSFIHISLTDSEGKIVFLCDNSNYLKKQNDQDGVGVELENMHHRLELVYQNRYRIEQKTDKEWNHLKIVIEQ
ncbi:MAG: histidine kinase [Prevotella histicola]|jgi:histidine kinase|uniref:sensor histidine kinase n=1 Tax=Prevotella histicola TaxID=470565 RepID=UPI001CAE9780|nr:sensor histidine kinase [Prevotella histicola]MBF1422299.1 histidine kinase [Prevotella histicola]